MSDLYERLRRIRENRNRKDEGRRSADLNTSPPGDDWERIAHGVYRRGRSMELPDRYAAQIGTSGEWHGVSSVFRVGETIMPLFLDVETSGLSAGAGSVAFLIGIGRLRRNTRECAVEVEQFFLADLGAENLFTEAVHRALQAEHSDGVHITYVSYNGATFDLPVLRTRSIMVRRHFPEHFHIDLLPVTRRLYRARIGSCRLAAVERLVLRSPRDRDVPGSEVPERYLRFIRTGNTDGLSDVVEHHFYDIAHLAILGLHVNERLRDPERDHGGDDAPLPPDNAEVLRLLLERADRNEREAAEAIVSRRVHRRTFGESGNAGRFESSRWLRFAALGAGIARREGKWDELLTILHRMYELRGSLHDAVELAKQLEHRRRAYTEALRVVSTAGERWGWNPELEHRAARLRRRIRRNVLSTPVAYDGSPGAAAPRKDPHTRRRNDPS